MTFSMRLVSKLKFSDASPLVLLNAPNECKPIFEGLDIRTSVTGKDWKQVMLFTENKKALDVIFEKVINKLAEGAVFWIAYPKKSSGIVSDLIRNSGWDVVFNSDYRIVSSASIDDTWSAVRVSRKKTDEKYKSSVPMEERKVQGVDYVKRTVTLPKDALEAMKPYKGLADFFHGMSFTHKREYVESIEDAKKPETRQRRIQKMIEMVAQLKKAKENKKK